jgi:predicted YcjX-like family ATPase
MYYLRLRSGSKAFVGKTRPVSSVRYALKFATEQAARRHIQLLSQMYQNPGLLEVDIIKERGVWDG